MQIHLLIYPLRIKKKENLINPVIPAIVAEDISIKACKQKQNWTDFIL